MFTTTAKAAGNTATCSFVVTVLDAQAPVIACPSDVTTTNDLNQCSAVVTYAVSGSDNCGVAGTNQLAGSALRMDRGVANLMRLAGLSLADAVRMATVNPARAMRIGGREQGLAAGDRGDIVVFTLEEGRISVACTYASGAVVYRRN